MAEFAALVFGAVVGLVAVQVVVVAATVLAGWVLGVVVPAAGFGNRPPVLGVRVFGTRLYLADGWWAGGQVVYLPIGRLTVRWRVVAFFAAGPAAVLATGAAAAVAGFARDPGVPWQACAGFAAVFGVCGLVLVVPAGAGKPQTAGNHILVAVRPPAENRPNLLAYAALRHTVREMYAPLGERRAPAVFADLAAVAWAGLGARDAAAAALAAADELRDPAAGPEERLVAAFARGDVHRRVCGRFDEAEAAFLAARREFPGAPAVQRLWLDALAADCASRAGRHADAGHRLAAWDGVELGPDADFARDLVRGVVRVRAGESPAGLFPDRPPVPPGKCELVSAVWLLVLVADELAGPLPGPAAAWYAAAVELAFAGRGEFAAPDDEAAFVAATDDLLLRFRRAVTASGGNASAATTDLLGGLYRPPATAVSDEDAEEVQWRDFRRGLAFIAVASPTAFGSATVAILFGVESDVPAVKTVAVAVAVFASVLTGLLGLTTVYGGTVFAIHSFRPAEGREYGTHLLACLVISVVAASAITALALLARVR